MNKITAVILATIFLGTSFNTFAMEKDLSKPTNTPVSPKKVVRFAGEEPGPNTHPIIPLMLRLELPYEQMLRQPDSEYTPQAVNKKIDEKFLGFLKGVEADYQRLKQDMKEIVKGAVEYREAIVLGSSCRCLYENY